MDSAVVAAIIGVAGTVIVGVTGFGANVWGIRQTIAHDRNNRVWDQRAAVYIEALTALNYRKVSRDLVTRPMSDSDRQAAQRLLATYQQPDWHKLEARLQAFASEPVTTAMQGQAARRLGALGAWQ